jgi:hypothetical protein
MGTLESVKPPYSEEILREAREKGWPEDLLAEARSVGIGSDEIRRGLHWGTPERFARRVALRRRLSFGDLRGRQATYDENEAFTDLWAHSPEEIGEWDVTVEREPNAFAQFRLQEQAIVTVLEQDGQLIATVSWSIRNTIVGGKRLRVSFGQALRVRDTHRRAGYGDAVRTVSWPVGVVPDHTQYDYIRSQNHNVVNWWKKFSPDALANSPERPGDVPGIPTDVYQYPATDVPAAAGVRAAEREDLATCAALINRTHEGLDLFRPYNVEFLEDRLDEGIWGDRVEGWPSVYAWGEFLVLEEGGEIVACAGLWDRGRDIRERWRHRATGEERVIEATALIDFGFAEGQAAAMARLIEHLIGQTQRLGRDMLLAPLEQLPEVRSLLADHEPTIETRALQWRMPELPLTKVHVDLVYW